MSIFVVDNNNNNNNTFFEFKDRIYNLEQKKEMFKRIIYEYYKNK